jgi:tetratricopeptide (TPR) repeat protein
MLGAYARAITEYKRAVKLNKRSAVFHANLGMAYLTSDHMDGARTEFRTALELDPSVLDHHPDGGVTLRALEAKDFSKLCFETARAYIERNQMEQAKVWLQRAGENGIDLRVAMDDDKNLRPLLKDPDIRLLIANTEAFRKRLALDSAPILPRSNRSQSFPE